jgi:hypothetical protein
LKEKFSGNYEITHKSFEAPTDDWSQDIKIRKGNKIGAAVDLKWYKKMPHDLEIEVSSSSKTGSIITYPIAIAFILIGAYMGYNHIGPFDGLPGKKIAGAIAGLLMLIPGSILIFILQKMLISKDEREQSQKLIAEINDFIKK